MDLKPKIPVKRKIICPTIWAIITSSLFLVSLFTDYQYEAIREHVRFRQGLFSRGNWKDPPDGTFRSYIFNVTNAEAFLNGTHKKLHLQEVGPFVYKIKLANTDLVDNDEESTLTYRKIRKKSLTFVPELNAPGIMNQKIYIPNVVLFSIVSMINDWFFLTKNVFEIVAKDEPIFVHQTVGDILWNYTTPLIDDIRQWWPGVTDNLGMIYQAFPNVTDVFTINIGTQNGLENFFKIRTYNNETVMRPHFNKKNTDPEKCPVHVKDAFDNTIFPPYRSRDDRFSVVGLDSCRTFPIVYEKDVFENGFHAFKFVMTNDSASCLEESMGVPLPKGLFDVSGCRNDAPSAYSQPHFYGTSYKFEEHFEGLSPNKNDHETMFHIEPKTGVIVEEKFRFQQSLPLPQLTGFNKAIERFSGMMIPCFWYEYDLDDLPAKPYFLVKLIAVYMPYVQKVFLVIFFLGSVASLTVILRRKLEPRPRKRLWFGQGQLQQTITESPTNEKYCEDSQLFLPKNVIKA